MTLINKCPLCGSNDTSMHLNASDFSVFKCKSCTNAWTSPLPNTINYVERDFHQYEISDRSDIIKKVTDLAKPWQKSIGMQIESIKKNLKAGSSVLEIGCGEGILLRELTKAGFSTFGIEPSVTAANRAVQQGLNVIQGYFPVQRFDERKFDLIVMSHVFEHLERPLEILDAIKYHLVPGGKLMFVQTYYEGILPRLLKEKWYAWLPEQHFWHFTPTGLVKITESMGFYEVEREFSSLVYYNRGKYTFSNSVFFVIEKLFWVFPDSFKDQFHLVLTLEK